MSTSRCDTYSGPLGLGAQRPVSLHRPTPSSHARRYEHHRLLVYPTEHVTLEAGIRKQVGVSVEGTLADTNTPRYTTLPSLEWVA